MAKMGRPKTEIHKEKSLTMRMLPEQRERLEFYAKKYGLTKTQVVLKALEKLYEEEGNLEQSWAICRESMERIPDSEKLWLAYLEKHLKDAGIERQVCAQLVKKAVDTLPNLTTNIEFQKLQKQYL